MAKIKEDEIVYDVQDITINTRFVNLLLADGNDFGVDIKALMKAPTHSEDAYINITPILKAYNRKFSHWIRFETNREYINLVNDEILNKANLPHLKNSENEGNFKGGEKQLLKNSENDSNSNTCQKHDLKNSKNDGNSKSGEKPYLKNSENDSNSNTRKLHYLKNSENEGNSKCGEKVPLKNSETKPLFKPPFVKSQWFLKSKYDWLNNDCPLICTRKGRYNSGTWLHKELFLKFIGTMNVRLEREMHKLVMSIITQTDSVKKERQETKHKFHPLTLVIKNIYIPAQTRRDRRDYAYANIMDIANVKVLGFTAKEYKSFYNLDMNTTVRDTLSEDELNDIVKVEEHLHGLIKYGEITDLQVLKSKIENAII